MILVESAGVFASVQDRGRPGWSQVGVGRSGAFDPTAAALANRLVGNDETAAVVEALGGGLRLRASQQVTLAVTGAQGSLSLAGRSAPRNAPLILARGDVLEIGSPTVGLRSYLGVRGGVAVPVVLGSRSWDTLGRVGPPPLAPGYRLALGAPSGVGPLVEIAPIAALGAAVLDVVAAPRVDWFTPAAWQLLTETSWEVLPASDRVGIRLSGPVLERRIERVGAELPPEPMVRGAIQVPPDGRPIILGPDHPTTGGYPVIGVVSTAGVARCAHLVPGERVRLRAILDPGR